MKSVVLEKLFDQDKVKEFNAASKDWTATCPVCKVTFTGTLKELKEHKHDK